jgi:membrane associated rhomboid family serine protease
MAHAPAELLEIILRECARAQPHPWYAAHFAQATGVPRQALDANLDRLRLSGLVKLTEWMPDHGQGYQITPEGEEVLRQPRLLARLRAGDVPIAKPQAGPADYSRHALEGQRGEMVRMALIDDSRPIVTLVLIAINVVWFVAELVVYMQHGGQGVPTWSEGGQAYQQALDITGAISLDTYADGQWWRLLTAAFVHIGLFHIGMNMFALYRLGPLLERMLGHAGYLMLYLLSAVGSSMTVLWFPPHAAAGASGAICGLFGAMAMWLFLNKGHLPQRIVQAWQSNIFMNVVLMVIISLMPGISWSGHLGGAVAGAIVAVPLNWAHFGVGPQRWLGWVATAAIAIVGFALWQMAFTTYVLSPVESGSLAGTRLGRDLSKAEELAIDVGNAGKNKVVHANPPLDAAQAAELQRQIQNDTTDLEARIAALQKVQASAPPKLAPVIQAGLDFFVPTAAFGRKIIKICEAGGRVTPEMQRTLDAEYRNLVVAQRAFSQAWKAATSGG